MNDNQMKWKHKEDMEGRWSGDAGPVWKKDVVHGYDKDVIHKTWDF